MAKFLNTSAVNYYLEDLIKQTRDRLIVISPFLKFNPRIKELIEDKDRLKIDVRIVYGKSELAPQEINWLGSLEFVRTSFCQNLHAKCYLNERAAIITSMNLYDFSQVNNNEMGVYIERESEPDLYRDTYDEAQRLVRISDAVRLAAQKIEDAEALDVECDQQGTGYETLTTSRLAKERGMKTSELLHELRSRGFIRNEADRDVLTEEGKRAGGDFRVSKKYGPYFLWPKDLEI